MRILFTCGGTAGHINPALGVAGRIQELWPDVRILFVGAEGHMETELVPREGYELKTVRVSGIERGLSLRAIGRDVRALALAARAVADARRIVREFAPDAAVGTGGYVCYPVLRAAAELGVPTAVHESNAVPGLTTRLLESRMTRILVGLPESRNAYRRPEKVELTGTPVRVAFRGADRARARRELGLPAGERIVLAVFGSLGAGRMNEILAELIKKMGHDAPFRLIYATGKQYYDDVRAALTAQGRLPRGVDLRAYIYDMPKVMAAADLVLCRSGASTIGELTYLGKPAVLVPSPNVANNHQEKNARVLAEAGAARMLPEPALTGAELYDTIRSLLEDGPALARMHEASMGLGLRDATDRIAAIVLELAQR